MLVKSNKMWKMLASAIIIFLLLIAGFYLYHRSYIKEEKKSAVISVNQSGEWMLTDSYDGPKSSFEDFFNREDALSVLKKTYNMLKKEYKEDYLEVGEQNIEYIGKYQGKLKTVDGNKEALNQKIGDQWITPLKCVQVSSNYVERFELQKKIEKGMFFENSDYHKTMHHIVPVILGADDRAFFNVGDEFWGIYLGDAKVRFQVKGFFDKSTYIILDHRKIVLDSCILMPSLQISSKDMEEFQKTLLSVKCQGYFRYKNKKEFENNIDKIKKIKRVTGYKYVVPITKKDVNQYFAVDIRISLALSVVCCFLWALNSKKVNTYIFELNESVRKKIIFSLFFLLMVYVIGFILIFIVTTIGRYFFVDMGSERITAVLYTSMVHMINMFYKFSKGRVK